MPETTILPTWARQDDEAFRASHPIGARPRTSALNRVLIRALVPVLREFPSEADLQAKPLSLELRLPLPPRLRFYIFRATQHESERKVDTYRVQLTAGQAMNRGRYVFSREEGVRPVLLGFEPRLEVFIIWDADVNDAGGGFTFSQGVQSPPEIVYRAAAMGMAEGVRHARRAAREEVIIATRADKLVDGLLRRIELSNRALMERGNAD
jgi:hypothetical protein